MEKIAPKDIDNYIASFPIETQKLLNQVRETIKAAAPEAVECISYQMPAYKLNGILVYFAGYEKQIGFYPTSSAIAFFSEEIAGYKNAKGSVQFPLNKEMPLELISKMVVFRVKENLLKTKKKK